MNKIFVLDTNVLIHNPQSLFSFGKNRVVVPITVIEEIDNFKKGVDEKGRNARQISRYLDKLRKKGSLQKGVVTESGGTVQVVMSHKLEESTKDLLLRDENDNLIIGTALYIKKEYENSEIFLISKDANVRIKADAVGIKSLDFEVDRVNFEELYTGVLEYETTIEQYETLSGMEAYNLQENKLDLKFSFLQPNQFIKFTNRDNKELKPYLMKYRKQDNKLFPLQFYKGQDIFGIKARNEEQSIALELLLDDSIQLVTLLGIAGTGKTLLAMAAGLQKVIEEDKYKRLVISRPISPIGKDLGYLPGTKSEKFNPWMQPIYDNMEILITRHDEKESSQTGKIFGKKKTTLNDYLDFGFIELEPLTYIRGRSLPNQFIIIDEAQNLTPHEMKTIITRAGENTKIIMTGDPYQIDIPYLDSESNGLSVSVEKLKEELIVGHVTLKKGERSTLAEIAAKHF